MHGKVLLIAAALLLFCGCARSGNAGNKNAKPPVKSPSAATAAAVGSSVPEAPVEPKPRPIKKRKLVVDENGNAYQLLRDGERMCEDCDL